MDLLSRSSDETEHIGFTLGKKLKAGDIVGLYGDLGAGKTTFVKGIARAFGISGREIASASFTIIVEYEVNPRFYHIDLYRIEKNRDLDSVGIWECLSPNAVSVIEWADRIDSLLPAGTIRVRILTAESDSRKIFIEGIDEKNWNNL